MGFRSVIIHNRSKLECSLNYLICRKEEENIKILMDEIRTIVIDTSQVSITSCLMSECMKKKIKMIFTDDSHNPIGELVPYQNNYYSYRHIKEQIGFNKLSKDVLWQKIIQRKILNQAYNLKCIKKDDQANKLYEYFDNVLPGDTTNREGHAAKVYFNSIFGMRFSRNDDKLIENKYLNYGYSIILSSINKEIKSLGYLTELGIHHIGESNPFNLSCDFMEPLRPLVDLLILNGNVNEDNFKKFFVEMLSKNVKYKGKQILLENSIHLYVEDLFNYMCTGDINKIEFIDYGEL